MKFDFQSNIKDSKGFSLYVKREYEGQVEEYITDEGLAILYNANANQMITTGSMTTENLIRAIRHIMQSVIKSYKEKNEGDVKGFIKDTCTVLDSLDEMITNEVDNYGSVDDFRKKG